MQIHLKGTKHLKNLAVLPFVGPEASYKPLAQPCPLYFGCLVIDSLSGYSKFMDQNQPTVLVTKVSRSIHIHLDIYIYNCIYII